MIDSPTRHFLDLDQFSAETLRQMITSAGDYKAGKIVSEKSPANGKVLALVFEKPSTRTRVSFEVGMMQMGGIVTSLDVQSSQLGRGESIADTARAL